MLVTHSDPLIATLSTLIKVFHSLSTHALTVSMNEGDRIDA